MPELTIHKSSGGTGGSLTLQDGVFGGEVNGALLHQAVLRQQADRRQGTHDSQTRAEVSRTTKKVWRQKGTGRARQGSRKGPHWAGGGVAFGPHPRSHTQDMPKKMRAAALRSALASKVSAGELMLIDGISMQAPSTKQLAQLLSGLDGGSSANASTLLLLEGSQPAVQLSARNIAKLTTATVDNINPYDLLRHKRVIMTVTAARRIEARYGEGDESTVERTQVEPLPRVEKREPVAAVKTAAKKTATKAASKGAAKAAATSAEPGDAAEDAEPNDETASKTAAKTARKRATKSATKSAETEE